MHPNLLRRLGAHCTGDDNIRRRAMPRQCIHEIGMFSWRPLPRDCHRCFPRSVFTGQAGMLVPDVLAQGSLGWELLVAVAAGVRGFTGIRDFTVRERGGRPPKDFVDPGSLLVVGLCVVDGH